MRFWRTQPIRYSQQPSGSPSALVCIVCLCLSHACCLERLRCDFQVCFGKGYCMHTGQMRELGLLLPCLSDIKVGMCCAEWARRVKL